MPAAPEEAGITLILASTSVYRARLLQRLGLSFRQLAPEVDESLDNGTEPRQRALRLAHAKADAVARIHPDHWVIGSDQVASCDGEVLHKPGSAERQRAQLRRMAGREARFDTAVCLVGPGFVRHAHSLTRVRVRSLTDEEIRRYVAAEPAVDCAGGFRCEALGISLFARIVSRDPTALEGLPLIATARLLRAAAFRVP